MNIYIEPISPNNFEKVINLKVKKNQLHFIESNVQSIAESKAFDYWNPIAIYVDNNIIGFAMYGYVPMEDRVWLDRFMIDKHYQGKGYGKQVLNFIIEYIKNTFNTKEIFLSLFEDNEGAFKLYDSIGFKFNGELDLGGEKIMCLKL